MIKSLMLILDDRAHPYQYRGCQSKLRPVILRPRSILLLASRETTASQSLNFFGSEILSTRTTYLLMRTETAILTRNQQFYNWMGMSVSSAGSEFNRQERRVQVVRSCPLA